jgi:hypothetical protein
MGWKRLAINLFNRPMGALGLRLVPIKSIQWWTSAVWFDLWGRQYPCFSHPYNCGWPPYTTERSVELALADAWLNQVGGEVVEVGAVTPYYWPGRVGRVIDPYDSHARVTDRQSLFNVDLRGASVLSISTFEHIGTGDYGISESPELLHAAFRKLFDESPQFLLTVPMDYNPRVDRFLFETREVPADVALAVMVREGASERRQEREPGKTRHPYRHAEINKRFPTIASANAVIVMERGGTLAAGRDALAVDNPSTVRESVPAGSIGNH